MRSCAITKAPSVRGHIPTHLGVARMREFLNGTGFAEQLNTRRAGVVAALPYNPDRDPLTPVMNPKALRQRVRHLHTDRLTTITAIIVDPTCLSGAAA